MRVFILAFLEEMADDIPVAVRDDGFHMLKVKKSFENLVGSFQVGFNLFIKLPSLSLLSF